MTSRQIPQDKARNLYHRANELMAELGAEGTVSTRHPLVDAVMDALHDIDAGAPWTEETPAEQDTLEIPGFLRRGDD